MMNTPFIRNSFPLILWFLVVCFFLHNAVAQRAASHPADACVENYDFEDYKITTWNVEWLSCLTYGPKDRELQIDNVVTMIKTMNSDLVALQEVGTSNLYTTMDTLVRRLGSEWDGVMVPWNANNCSQNQGIVYKKSKINTINASLIKDGGSSYHWASGRFPALYEVNFVVANRQFPISFINIHAKAYADEVSYSRRREASIGLKNLLDSDAYNTKRIVIIGDFNDYLEGTICRTCGGVSPYKNFMDDTDNFKGITSNLNTVDHLIISNELFDNYINTSIFREFSASQTIPNYYTTTSDHIPTSVTFRIPENVSVIDLPEIAYFQVFPNPTDGRVSIRWTGGRVDKWTSVDVFDVFGRKVKGEGRLPQDDGVVVDISHLPAGVYFLKINTEKGMITKKIVKM